MNRIVLRKRPIVKGEKSMATAFSPLYKNQRDYEFNRLYDKAHEAGMKAVEGMAVTPMVVQEHSNPLDDNSPVKKEWFVADGVCGFAWIIVKPGNCPFANWLKKSKGVHKDYYGGVSIHVREFNQSLQRKEVYAAAFAKVLSEAGIKAYSQSRMD